MRVWLLLCLLAVSVLEGRPERPVVNVNSRYFVESVQVEAQDRSRLSRSLLEDLERMVGERLNQPLLNGIKDRLRRELGSRTVVQRLDRGTQPDRVRVTFEVEQEQAEDGFGARLPALVYHSRLGWDVGLEGEYRKRNSVVGLGFRTDGDTLLERYTGLTGRFEQRRLFTDRVRFQTTVQLFHQQWNAPTLRALERRPDLPGIYRNRRAVSPTLLVTPWEGVQLQAGVDLQQFQTQFPAARDESAHALITTLRIDREWTGLGSFRHRLDAGYNLRAATSLLGSDYRYSRHTLDAAYTLTLPRHSVTVRGLAGRAGGRVPLYERYVLGNSRVLRGWNKYDVNPLGGSRVFHGSLEVQTAPFVVFYDAGTVYDRGESRVVRHSAGGGVRLGSFLIALAFPLRSSVSPVLIAGLTF